MLFGFLHRVTNAIIDLKETLYLWFYLHVKFVRSCQIKQIFSSSSCVFYTSAASPIFVVLQPNLQDMLTIAQKNSYTAFCLFICFTLVPGLFPIWNNRNNLCYLTHISRSFWKKKIGFRRIKLNEMIVFGSRLYHYLVYVHLYSVPFFAGN